MRLSSSSQHKTCRSVQRVNARGGLSEAKVVDNSSLANGLLFVASHRRLGDHNPASLFIPIHLHLGLQLCKYHSFRVAMYSIHGDVLRTASLGSYSSPSMNVSSRVSSTRWSHLWGKNPSEDLAKSYSLLLTSVMRLISRRDEWREGTLE